MIDLPEDEELLAALAPEEPTIFQGVLTPQQHKLLSRLRQAGRIEFRPIPSALPAFGVWEWHAGRQELARRRKG